ncbi:MAG: hypothetical protein KF813_10995 [Trueperaceae bacterium]|nr:hypothetical protein [Trueperaceae bacterium]
MHPRRLSLLARRLLTSLLTSLATALLLATPALAQSAPHSHLLPASSVAVISHIPGGIDLSVLEPALAGLDVVGVSEIFANLTGVALAGEQGLTFDGLISSVLGNGMTGMAEVCPQLSSIDGGSGFTYLAGPLTVAVTVSQFRPMPGFIALLTPSDGARASAMVSAIASCFQTETVVLDQDGVRLYQFGGSTDGRGTLAFFDDVALLASDTDLARAVVRLARGSNEPSLRSSAVGAVAAEVTRPGLSVVVDGDAIANLAAAFTPATTSGADPLTDRLVASLRTLGGFGMHIALRDGAFEISTVLTPNQAGGDATLARMLTCEGCSPISLPDELPAGTVTVAAGTLPVNDLVTWIDGWLSASESMTGETMNVRGLVSEYLGLDLDAGLLNWWDGAWYSVQLGLPGVDMNTFLHGVDTITVLPVRSEAAAAASLDQWAAGLTNLTRLAPPGVLQALFGMVSFDEPGSDDEAPLFHATDVTYRGVSYQRWRSAPVLDVAVMVEDGQLIIATPASVMRRVIDFRIDAARGAMDAHMQSALPRVARGAVAYAVHDFPRALAHYASIIDTVSTPVASAMTMSFDDVGYGYDEYYYDDFWNDYSEDLSITGMGGYPEDHFGANPRLPESAYYYLWLGSYTEVEITSDSVIEGMNLGIVYDLAGLTPGETILIEVEDPEPYTIDTMLFLFDLTNGRVIAANDDAPSTYRSAIVFEVQEGIDYAAVVTSWSGMSTGRVLVSATVVGAEDDSFDESAGIVAPEYPSEWDDDFEFEDFDVYEPTFSEILRLFDFASGFVDGLARMSGVSVSATHVDGGVVRSSFVVPLRR